MTCGTTKAPESENTFIRSRGFKCSAWSGSSSGTEIGVRWGLGDIARKFHTQLRLMEEKKKNTGKGII